MDIKNISYKHIVFIVLSFFLGSCVNLPSITSGTWEPKEITTPFLLGLEHCEIPCWEGIVIGEKTFEETLSLLEEKQKNNEMGELDYEKDNYIRYIETSYSVILYFHQDSLILMSFSNREYDLGSIVKHFGVPDGYTISEDQHGYILDIYYSKLGLVFLTVEDFTSVEKNMSVVGVRYLKPASEVETFYSQYFDVMKIIMPDVKKLEFFNWQGFGKCPEGLEFPGECKSQ